MTAPTTPPADDKDWTFVLTEGCAECGFDPAVDLHGTGARLRSTLPRWRAALAASGATNRPAPLVWSPLEYGCHVRDVFRIFAARLALMLGEDGATFANWDQDATAVTDRYWAQDLTVVADELAGCGEALAAAFDAVPSSAWGHRGIRSNGSLFTVATFAAYLLHDVEHHLHDVHA